VQVWVPVQAVVQVPQWASSVWRSTQLPLQSAKPVSQLAWQLPAEHTSVPVQALVQVPQWALSVWRLKQVPSQSVSPFEQGLVDVEPHP
jgi:hypothetical protein